MTWLDEEYQAHMMDDDSQWTMKKLKKMRKKGVWVWWK